jgi:hypothetical protein
VCVCVCARARARACARARVRVRVCVCFARTRVETFQREKLDFDVRSGLRKKIFVDTYYESLFSAALAISSNILGSALNTE